MATQLQIRRGTSTQVAAFTGAEGEIVVNTTNDSVHVNDGSTQGGFELARVDGANWNVTNNISTTGSVTAASLVVDTTTLVVDATNNRVGAGVASPQSNMHVLGTLKVATGNAQGILGLGEGAGTTVNVGIWRGAANNPTSDGNFLNLGGYDGIVFAASAAAIGSQTEAMRILSNQRVSIGGTSSNQLLNVTSSTTPALEFTRGSGNATIGIDNGNSIAVGGTAGDLVLRASGTTGVTKFTDSGGNITMTLTEANNVGLGITNPSAILHVKNTTSASQIKISDATNTSELQVASNGFYFNNPVSAGTFIFRNGTGLTERMRLTSTGLGIGTSSPGASTKLNVAGRGLFTGGGTDPGDGSAAGMSIGYDTSNGFGFIQAIQTGVATKPLRIQPVGTDHIVFGAGGAFCGIGTVSPSQPLHVDATGRTTAALFDNNGTNGDVVRVAKNGTDVLKIRAEGTADLALDANGGAFIFKEGGAEAARFLTNGTLLVGKTADDNSIGFKTNTSSTYMVASFHTPAFINRLSDTGGLLEFRQNSATKGKIGTDGSDIFIGSDDTNILFHTNGVLPANSVGGLRDAAFALGSSSARFVDLRLSGIMYSGSARIGTTVQQGTVTINNEAVNTCLTVHQTSTSVNYAPINVENEFVTGGSTGTMAFFKRADGTIVGSITSTITATAYATGSDQRLKDNIVDAPSAEHIDAIKVRSFDWKADGSHQKYGMVAQELQGVAPEAVIGNADSDDMMMVDYSKLVPMLVKEIQSLRARVAQLEDKE